jgi:hypothetical protein
MNIPDAVTAILNLLSTSNTFTGSHPLYSVVKFVRAYPLDESIAEPTVALWQSGGPEGRPHGLGVMKAYRTPRLRMDILARTPLECERIYQAIREEVIADVDHRNSYLSGGAIKEIAIGEPHGVAAWDESGRVQHLACDITIKIRDE